VVERSIFRSTVRSDPIGLTAAVDHKSRPLQPQRLGQAAAVDLKIDRSTGEINKTFTGSETGAIAIT